MTMSTNPPPASDATPTAGTGGAGDICPSSEEMEYIGLGGDWARMVGLIFANRLRIADGQIRALIAERDALRAAVEPFAKMASGIPDNWPGDVVLFYDIANPAHPERGLSLGYWPAWFNDGGWRPTIDDYRRIAALARGPAAGETTDGGGKG
jgi:hypothetical protein